MRALPLPLNLMGGGRAGCVKGKSVVCVVVVCRVVSSVSEGRGPKESDLWCMWVLVREVLRGGRGVREGGGRGGKSV